jgi:peptide deformylase
MCYYGNPVLRKTCTDVAEITDDIRQLGEDMIVTMREHNGIGLAGPQVGKLLNMFVLEIPGLDDDDVPGFTSPGEIALQSQMPMVIINPKLSDFSEQILDYNEGCLSIPGVQGDVSRPEFVQLDATLPNGAAISYRCGGLLARCIQHEFDHLNGKLFIDYVDDDVIQEQQDLLDEIENRGKKQR